MRMNSILNGRAQTIMEYAIILGFVAVALSAMQVYIRRGIQAGIKVAADELGNQQDAEKIDPGKSITGNSEINTRATSNQTIEVFEGGSQTVDIDKTTTASGGSEYISWE